MGSKEKLIEAMASLLWERGYAATSPREVMAAAGVGQGSMYHHFSGKHDLAVQAMRLSIDTAMAGNATLTADGDPLDRLKANLLAPRPGTKGCRVGRMTQDPEVLADPELLGLVGEAFEQMHRLWADPIREAIDAGQLPPQLDPEDLASTLQAVLQGGYVLSRAQGEQAPMDAAMRGAVALLDAAADCRDPAPKAPRNHTAALGPGLDRGEHIDKKESA